MMVSFRLKLFCVAIVSGSLLHSAVPKLTLVMVIDQFAYRSLQRERRSLRYGIKKLCNEGVFFHNAIMPSGLTKTAPDHCAIATGTFASNHGIIDNEWYDQNLKTIVNAYDDPSKQGKIIGSHDPEKMGKSAKNLKVDTLSDQLILDPVHGYTVYSMGYTTEPAISMAGHLGKAIWYDTDVGKFTSSKAYFNKLPDWLVRWNQKNDNALHQYIKVHSAGIKQIYFVEADPFVADLVISCMRDHYAKPHAKPLVIWFNFAGVDEEGHFYGPESHQVKARIHLLDRLVANIMREAYTHVKKQEALFVLLGDHGVMPLPESVPGGLSHRINLTVFKNSLNQAMFAAFGIQDLVTVLFENSLYIDQAKLVGLTAEQRVVIMNALKAAVRSQDGIQDAWTFDELQRTSYDQRDVRTYLRNQLYPGRSGDIIFLIAPYTLLSNYPIGTAHISPYDYDNHIPLIIYQKCRFEHTQIYDTVYGQQLPVTLAHLLHVPKPSAASMDMLPGVHRTTVQSVFDLAYRLWSFSALGAH